MNFDFLSLLRFIVFGLIGIMVGLGLFVIVAKADGCFTAEDLEKLYQWSPVQEYPMAGGPIWDSNEEEVIAQANSQPPPYFQKCSELTFYIGFMADKKIKYGFNYEQHLSATYQAYPLDGIEDPAKLIENIKMRRIFEYLGRWVFGEATAEFTHVSEYTDAYFQACMEKHAEAFKPKGPWEHGMNI